jgi:hypothetical protein
MLALGGERLIDQHPRGAEPTHSGLEEDMYLFIGDQFPNLVGLPFGEALNQTMPYGANPVCWISCVKDYLPVTVPEAHPMPPFITSSLDLAYYLICIIGWPWTFHHLSIAQTFAVGDILPILWAFREEDVVISGPTDIAILCRSQSFKHGYDDEDEMRDDFIFVPVWGPDHPTLAGQPLPVCVEGITPPFDVLAYLYSWWPRMALQSLESFMERYLTGMPGAADSLVRMSRLLDRDVPVFLNKVARLVGDGAIAEPYYETGYASKPSANGLGSQWYQFQPHSDGIAIWEDPIGNFPNCNYPETVRAKIGRTSGRALMQYYMAVTSYQSEPVRAQLDYVFSEYNLYRRSITNIFIAATYQWFWYRMGWGTATVVSALRQTGDTDSVVTQQIQSLYSANLGTGGIHTKYATALEKTAKEVFKVDGLVEVFDNIYIHSPSAILLPAPILNMVNYEVLHWSDIIPSLVPDAMMRYLAGSSKLFNSWETYKAVGDELSGMTLTSNNFTKVDAIDPNDGREEMLGIKVGRYEIYGARTGTDPVIDDRWSAAMLIKAMVLNRNTTGVAATPFVRTFTGRRPASTTILAHTWGPPEQTTHWAYFPTSSVVRAGQTIAGPDRRITMSCGIYDNTPIPEYMGKGKEGIIVAAVEGTATVRTLRRNGIPHPSWTLTPEAGVSPDLPYDDDKPGVAKALEGPQRQDPQPKFLEIPDLPPIQNATPQNGPNNVAQPDGGAQSLLQGNGSGTGAAIKP